ncbi:hypothetical protein MMC34_007456 [Xylographa carneopallida]|nr:hypothetical protein [Xylographa carneopallida]
MYKDDGAAGPGHPPGSWSACTAVSLPLYKGRECRKIEMLQAQAVQSAVIELNSPPQEQSAKKSLVGRIATERGDVGKGHLSVMDFDREGTTFSSAMMPTCAWTTKLREWALIRLLRPEKSDGPSE